MSNQVSNTTYVSSIENKYKRAKLNNVIKSLSDYIDCSSPDETNQDYGLLKYNGPIYKDLVIHGNKRPKKTNTPVIVSNTFLGTIDINGDLKITNTCANNSIVSVCDIYEAPQYSAAPVSGCSSAYWCDATVVTCCITCCQCYDADGPYIERVSCCTWRTPVHERCVFNNAYKTVAALDGDYGYLANKYIDFDNNTYFYDTTCSLGAEPNWKGYSIDRSYGARGSYYAGSLDYGYYWSNGCLCYRVVYSMNSTEQDLAKNVSCWVDDSTNRSGIGTYAGYDGPFMTGIDVDTGKMKWDKLPSNVSVTVNPSSNMYYCSYFCVAGNDKSCYHTYLTTGAYSASKVRANQLMVCMNTYRCCTLCVVSKLRNIECLCIHERYL